MDTFLMDISQSKLEGLKLTRIYVRAHAPSTLQGEHYRDAGEEENANRSTTRRTCAPDTNLGSQVEAKSLFCEALTLGTRRPAGCVVIKSLRRVVICSGRQALSSSSSVPPASSSGELNNLEVVRVMSDARVDVESQAAGSSCSHGVAECCSCFVSPPVGGTKPEEARSLL